MTPPSLPDAVSVAAWLGTWSRPHERGAQGALVIAAALVAVAFVPHAPRWLAFLVDISSVTDLKRRRRFLTVASFAAAFLSLGYIALYLRGGPRAPEASTYWLQGRALSHGALAWRIGEPSASFRARDLFFVAPNRLSGIFAPGYPLLLAPGFLVGAPMLVGPLLAAALVVATWLLAHEVVADAPDTFSPARAPEREAIARLAAGLSIVSAALRYHTADTLPHGGIAVAVAASLACALRAGRTGDTRLFGVAGAAIGFVVASYPPSAVAVGVIAAILALGSRASGRGAALAWMCGGALPGILFLLAGNFAATGHAFVSPAGAYAKAASGGTSVGVQSLVGALRCIREHLMDVANFEPLPLLALVALFGGRRRSAARVAALVIAGQIATQAAVGLDPTGAGCGAALLVGVIPIEQVLVACGIARLFPRTFPSAAIATFALAFAGFALHASRKHEALAASDIGRPRFEPDAVREANVAHGLLFFDDDTGYELAHDPGTTASHGIEAVRMRGDDHDRLLYDSLGHPPVHRYAASAASASVYGWTPPGAGSEVWRFEAESDWPPVAEMGSRAEAIEAPSPCASEGHVLLVPDGATATIELPVPQGSALGETRAWRIIPRVLTQGSGTGLLMLVSAPGQKPLADWSWNGLGRAPTCTDLPAQAVELGGDHARAWLVVRAQGGSVMLDRTTLTPG
jgi:hypothetical protein